MDPIRRIAEIEASDNPKPHTVLKLVSRWRNRKLMEIQWVSVACTVLAAAVIGSFSWFSVPDAYWLALAMWYSSLFLSILGIALAAQQLAVLNILGELPEESESEAAMGSLNRYLHLMLSRQYRLKPRPKWKMVFIWQCPTMFMSYSLSFFLLGLTLLVCTPLIRGGAWNTNKAVAIFYLVNGAAAGLVFLLCSFWIYHFVDLEYDALESEGKENEPRTQQDQSFTPAHTDCQHAVRSDEKGPDPCIERRQRVRNSATSM
ncbi:MAG: hypothetical protein M1820_007097 [Bogoriella megaspora]|nr:MAG: hypothetical protein M1820_007097 [Bogoriella megaspora]